MAQRDHFVRFTLEGASTVIRVPDTGEIATLLERCRARVFPNERVVQFIPSVPEKKRRGR